MVVRCRVFANEVRLSPGIHAVVSRYVAHSGPTAFCFSNESAACCWYRSRVSVLSTWATALCSGRDTTLKIEDLPAYVLAHHIVGNVGVAIQNHLCLRIVSVARSQAGNIRLALCYLGLQASCAASGRRRPRRLGVWRSDTRPNHCAGATADLPRSLLPIRTPLPKAPDQASD